MNTNLITCGKNVYSYTYKFCKSCDVLYTLAANILAVYKKIVQNHIDKHTFTNIFAQLKSQYILIRKQIPDVLFTHFPQYLLLRPLFIKTNY